MDGKTEPRRGGRGVERGRTPAGHAKQDPKTWGTYLLKKGGGEEKKKERKGSFFLVGRKRKKWRGIGRTSYQGKKGGVKCFTAFP